jgi:polyhydroxyalkanoate synthesis regulator phasin
VPPVRRHPGHRGADVRDTVAEMAAKAQEISMEAGSKMAAAMKDVINAAAGLTSFAIESSRDLVQYMVRRGQMTQEEADKLIREAEDSWSKKHKGKKPPARVHEPPALKSIARPVAAVVAAVPAHRPAPVTNAKPVGVKKLAHKPASAKKKPIVKKKPAGAKKPAARKKSTAIKKPAAKK